ncbi:hypothetical protein ACFWWM_39145 [Streptomyces sp. NPDC058682]|uniref:hypothetical protein n=1 Tax=Streptomyces sp. NPDC058682 TaxID=3346596 RepID=UPI00364A2A4B
MTPADARSDGTEGEPTDLHRTVLWALLRHVSPAPGAERPGLTRVVLWAGHAPGTSVAYDLPWSTRTTPRSRGWRSRGHCGGSPPGRRGSPSFGTGRGSPS